MWKDGCNLSRKEETDTQVTYDEGQRSAVALFTHDLADAGFLLGGEGRGHERERKASTGIEWPACVPARWIVSQYRDGMRYPRFRHCRTVTAGTSILRASAAALGHMAKTSCTVIPAQYASY